LYVFLLILFSSSFCLSFPFSLRFSSPISLSFLSLLLFVSPPLVLSLFFLSSSSFPYISFSLFLSSNLHYQSFLCSTSICQPSRHNLNVPTDYAVSCINSRRKLQNMS
jgi:hypothetical protein